MLCESDMNPRGSAACARHEMNAPLYHCCSSFLSKCVEFCSSWSCSCDSLDWLYSHKMSAQLLRRGCGRLCLGVGIQGLVFIGAGDDAVACWPLVARAQQQTATPRGRRWACRPPVQPPVARSRPSSHCEGEGVKQRLHTGGGGDHGNGEYGMRDVEVTHDFPMSATETTAEEEMGEEGDRWRIERSRRRKRGRWVGLGRSISGDAKRAVDDGMMLRRSRGEGLS